MIQRHFTILWCYRAIFIIILVINIYIMLVRRVLLNFVLY